MKSVKAPFADMQFDVIKIDKKKMKLNEKKKDKHKNLKSIIPTFIQLEASLYLGGERISQYSYSKPQLFSQNIELNDEEIKFYEILDN